MLYDFAPYSIPKFASDPNVIILSIDLFMYRVYVTVLSMQQQHLLNINMCPSFKCSDSTFTSTDNSGLRKWKLNERD